MRIFFYEPILSSQQQQKINIKTHNAKTQLIRFNYSDLIGKIHDFYNNFMDLNVNVDLKVLHRRIQ